MKQLRKRVAQSGHASLPKDWVGATSADFEKLVAVCLLSYPLLALAHLQLGRAYAVRGDTAKAKLVYQDFLTLWKDADPHVPIYKEAKAEYARLQ